MRVAIVDEDCVWREKIVSAIYKHEKDNGVIIDEYSSGERFLKSEIDYDLILIEIYIGEKNGFDTIVEAKGNGKTGRFVILTTHTEFSRKGYQVNAFRYIDKYKMEEEFCELFISLHNASNIAKFIDLPREANVRLDKIMFVETDRYKVILHTENGTVESRIAMNDLERIIEDVAFCRCHNSYIVNINKVKSFDKHFAYLINGQKIEISRRRHKEFEKKFANIKNKEENLKISE